MSAQPVDELLIKLSADVGGLVASLNKTGLVVEQLAGHIGEKIEKGTTRGFIKATVVIEAFKKALEFAKKATFDLVEAQYEAIDSSAKMADKLGITTEALAALKYNSELAGVGTEELSASVLKMQRALSEANDKSSKAAMALRVLNLDLARLKEVSPDQQLAIISQRIAAIEDPSERAAVAVELLGKNGVQLALSLKDGTEGLAQASAEAEKLGLSFSRVDAAKVEAANDSVTRLKMSFEGIATQLAITSAPYLEAIADWLTEIVGSSGGFEVQIKNVFQSLVTGVGYAMDALRGFEIMWGAIKVAVTGIGVAYYTVNNAIVKGLTEVARFTLNLFVDVANGVGQAFSSMLSTVADGLSYISEDAAATVREFAEAVKNSSTEVADEVKKKINGVADATIKDSERVTENAKNLFTEAKADLDATMNKPIPHEAVIEWGERIEAEATKRAEAIAKKIKNASSGLSPEDEQGMETGFGFADGMNALGEDKPKTMQGEEDAAKREEELQKLKEDLMTETEAEMAEYEHRKELLDEMKDADQISEEERRALGLKLDEDHQQRLLAIRQNAIRSGEKFSRQSWTAQTAHVISSLNQMVQGVEANSKTMFRIQKAFALANAIVNTALGITQALSNYPPPISFVMAAAQAAMGAVQIAAIGSSSFGGGGSSPAIGPAPSVSQGNANAGANGLGGNSSGGGRNVNITLIGRSYDRAQIEELVAAINDAGDDGVKIRR